MQKKTPLFSSITLLNSFVNTANKAIQENNIDNAKVNLHGANNLVNNLGIDKIDTRALQAVDEIAKQLQVPAARALELIIAAGVQHAGSRGAIGTSALDYFFECVEGETKSFWYGQLGIECLSRSEVC